MEGQDEAQEKNDLKERKEKEKLHGSNVNIDAQELDDGTLVFKKMNAGQEDEEWPQYDDEYQNGYNNAQYQDKHIESPKNGKQQDNDAL